MRIAEGIFSVKACEDPERVEAFEAMLKAALDQPEAERQKTEELKARDWEEPATCPSFPFAI